ncbi:MAG: hypothetical protein ABI572_08955 [Actinomycetota bacterium]
MATTRDTAPETVGERKPFGPVAAVFLSAGIASVVLGILTMLAEASASIKTKLELNAGVGALSGKTIGATLVFLVSWAILHVVYKGKDPEPKKIFMWTWILIAIGVVMTFPIFFQAFAPAE